LAGTSGGNIKLRQEEATTCTARFIRQPKAVPGLTLSLDRCSIVIVDAIAAVTAQDIVNTATTWPPSRTSSAACSTVEPMAAFLR